MYVLYKGFYSFRIGNLISDHLWYINESSSDLAKAQPYLSQSFHLTVSSLLLCLSVCLSPLLIQWLVLVPRSVVLFEKQLTNVEMSYVGGASGSLLSDAHGMCVLYQRLFQSH